MSSVRNNGLASRGEMLGRLATLFVCFSIYWCLSGAVLWWAYDISAVVYGGGYQRSEALVYVSKMALIITFLTIPVWLLQKQRRGNERRWLGGWSVAWKTAVVQLAYAAIVVIRRNLWEPSQGVSDYVMFLPIVGRVNGQFFSEFLWLIFLFPVVPITGLASGALYYLNSRILRRGGWRSP